MFFLIHCSLRVSRSTITLSPTEQVSHPTRHFQIRWTYCPRLHGSRIGVGSCSWYPMLVYVIRHLTLSSEGAVMAFGLNIYKVHFSFHKWIVHNKIYNRVNFHFMLTLKSNGLWFSSLIFIILNHHFISVGDVMFLLKKVNAHKSNFSHLKEDCGCSFLWMQKCRTNANSN